MLVKTRWIQEFASEGRDRGVLRPARILHSTVSEPSRAPLLRRLLEIIRS